MTWLGPPQRLYGRGGSCRATAAVGPGSGPDWAAACSLRPGWLAGWLASGVPPGGLGQGRRRLPDGRPAAQAAARKASPVPGRGVGGLPERAAGRSA